MTPPDPNITTLNEMADAYRRALSDAKHLRDKLDAYIQELKREGYSYPTLARESGLAQGTIQNIVAKED